MNHSLTSVPRSCRCPLIYLRKAVNFNLLRCILFPSTLREHEQSSSDEIPEVRCIHLSRAHFTEEASRPAVRCIRPGSYVAFLPC